MTVSVNKSRISLLVLALLAAAMIAILSFIDLKQQAYIRGMAPADKTLVRLNVQITPPTLSPTATPTATLKFSSLKGK